MKTLRFTYISLFIIIISSLTLHNSINVISERNENMDWTIIWNTSITLSNNFIIESGYTLLISPGVTIFIEKDVKIIVKGKLIANGTNNENIIFTNYLITDKWDSIEFKKGSTGIIQNSRIENSINGIKISEATNIIISNNYFNNISKKNIDIFHSSAMITDNVMINKSSFGIVCNNSTLTIINNTILSKETGIFINCNNNEENFFITSNNISNNEYGLNIMDSSNICINLNKISENNLSGILCTSRDKFSFDIEIINNSIENNKGNGIEIDGAQTFLKDNTIGNNKWGIYSKSGNYSLENNTFYNEKENNDYSGKIIQTYLLTVTPVDGNNRSIEDITVIVYNSYNNEEWNDSTYWTTTRPPGGILAHGRYIYSPSHECIEYIIFNNGSKQIYTPHTIYSYNKDIGSNVSKVYMNQDKNIYVLLDLQYDSDNDSIPDFFDFDDDNDGYNDTIEIADNTNPLSFDSIPIDFDKDFLPDAIDPDIDDDGILNKDDDYPYDPDKWEKEKDDYSSELSTLIWIVLIIIIFVALFKFVLKQRHDKNG